MKIAIVAGGNLPIPPRDWGAVELTIWYRKLYLEQVGHTVDVFNTRLIYEVIYAINRRCYDFVHCHVGQFVLACNAHLKGPYAHTSHYGGLHRFAADPQAAPAFNYSFEDTLVAPANIVLSERIRGLYEQRGYRGFLRVLRNGVEATQFRFAEQGNGQAVCVGRISARKRQAWLAEVTRNRVRIDFVGPKKNVESHFPSQNNPTARYLGVWDKPTLYDRLTDYSCLVLLSESEGAPKVVLEALAAGLSLVISEACAANLDDQPFITILPDDERRPEVIAEAIQSAIEQNGRLRRAIRAYALERFDYSVVNPEYLQIIREFREFAFHPLCPSTKIVSHPAS